MTIGILVLGWGAGGAAGWAAEESGGETAEPAIEAEGAEGDYLRALHERVHRRWADNFLPMAAQKLARDHEVNDPSRVAAVELSLDTRGALVEATVTGPSGSADFDGAALDIIKDGAPFPAPPEGVLSDDDRVHVAWTLARDHRRCGVARIVRKESPLDVALPKLVRARRDAEAVRRLAAAVESGSADPGVATFARAWLRRALGDRQLAPAAAAALLAAGDGEGEGALLEALSRGQSVPFAAEAAARAKASPCGAVRAVLGREGTPAQAAAIAALRLRADGDCVPALVAAAGNRKLPLPTRAAALEALGRSGDGAAREAVAAAQKDGSAALRAAALFASAQPGGGRAALYRLTPFLRDPALEVRAAAAGGLVRAVGDAALEQLYLIFKETDPRPYEAVAAELARLESAASAEILARMLRKEDRRIRVAAAAALAARADATAQKALEGARKDADAAVRTFAAGMMSGDERRAALAAAGGDAGTRLYRALARGAGRGAAAAWMLRRFGDADGAARIALLGEWLASARAGASVATAP